MSATHHEHPRGAGDDLILPLPPSAPRVPPNRFGRWLGRSILRLGGWRMVGTFPDIPKLVLIGAPHSSNWDGVWGFAAKLALGLDIKILGKRELFWWPLGAVLERLGVIAIDRSAAHGVVEQLATLIGESDKFWLGLAPEGTRKPVDRWKVGFWKIARAADVGILPAYFHYPDKVIGIGPIFETSDDMSADIARIRAWYRPWKGRHHGTP
ncbi:lysophospholipid acyltransferase family protein [Cognatiluteimonas profundi]|uniref:lysophospholipid acyltransferase family protein n=1 Tax=Cognatiluteimonas profundi TaxID=2594501 RepID=UPI00131E2B29|nr:lysophospholipid acyltransferase family protein [Lysobacter profundi]